MELLNSKLFLNILIWRNQQALRGIDHQLSSTLIYQSLMICVLVY
jgi:hypothetical protein